MNTLVILNKINQILNWYSHWQEVVTFLSRVWNKEIINQSILKIK